MMERRQQKEADVALQPVLHWVEAQQWPPWEKMVARSMATKGLWAKFHALRLIDGVMQRVWKEPVKGELRWQVVIPKTLRDTMLKAVHGTLGSGLFGSKRPSTASARDSTGAIPEGCGIEERPL